MEITNLRICIISYKLAMGGFSSSLLPALKYLSQKGVQVDLLLFEKSDIKPCEHPNVKVIYNDKKVSSAIKYLSFATNPIYVRNFIASFMKNPKKKAMRQLRWDQTLAYLNVLTFDRLNLDEYDCVVAWEEVFPSYFLSMKVSAKRKVGFIHSDYKAANFYKPLDQKGYNDLDSIVCVSKATTEIFKQEMPTYALRATTVYNLLDTERLAELSQKNIETFDKSDFDIVTVCRLDNKSKALDRLLRIAARIEANGYDFRWYVVGDGEDKEWFRAQVSKNGLAERVIATGAKANPHPYTRNADLFVLQSYYEGKPMVVEEAMFLNVPVLITEYGSAYEQVANGVTGFIAKNDDDSIYDKLIYVMDNEKALKAVKENLEKEDKSRYNNVDGLLQVIMQEGDIC